MDTNIAISGAGIVGSVLALLFSDLGLKVLLIEKRDDPKRVGSAQRRSTHLVISARGWKALREVGVESEVKKYIIPLRGRMVHGKSQRDVFQAYSPSGETLASITRAKLSEILLEKVSADTNIDIRFKTETDSYDPEKKHVFIKNRDSRRIDYCKYEWFFVAEGAFSKLRENLLLSAGSERWQKIERYGYKELPMSKDNALPLGKDVMHAWPRGRRSFYAFPNIDGSMTATLIAPFKGNESFESLRDSSDIVDMMRDFPLLDRCGFEVSYFQRPISKLFTQKCFPWMYDGNVVLIGDSAHSMVPFLGQGLNSGLEDCIEFIKAFLMGEGSFEEIRMSYENTRKTNADAVTDMSSNMFRELTYDIATEKFHLRKDIENILRHRFPERYFGTYESIAFSDISYLEAKKNNEMMHKLIDRVIEINGIKPGTTVAHIEDQIVSRMEEIDEFAIN